MKCVQCNTPIANNARFCPQCGLPVTMESSEAANVNEQIQEQEKPTSAVIVAESSVEQPEQREQAADSASMGVESASKSEPDVPIDLLPTQYELSTAPGDDVADEAARAQEEVSDASTEETVEIGPLMRAIAEAEAKAKLNDTNDISVGTDVSHPPNDASTPPIDTSHPPNDASTPPIDASHLLTDASTSPIDTSHPVGTDVSRPVKYGETARVPGRPRPAQAAKASMNIPSRPGPVPASPTPAPVRQNQVASTGVPTGGPARPRPTTARFQQSTQSVERAASEQVVQHSTQSDFQSPLPPARISASPVPPVAPVATPVPQQTLTSLPTMPLPAIPSTPQMPTVPPVSPVPKTPALPAMPIAPTQYFQAQPFSSRTRPGVIAMQQTRRRRNRRGCLPGFLIALVLVVALGAVGWVYVARPYLHDQAVSQIDQALTAEVNQLPTVLPLPGGTLRVTDVMLDNLLALSLPSNIPIQQAQVQINASGLQITFQTEHLSSTITGVPVASQGHLLLSQVAVKGVISLILSANDISSLFNQHIAAALARIHHSVRSVTLLSHEMDLVLA